MRARNIKPGFFKNENLSDLLPHARLLFIGLWCLADRDGRLEDRPKRICAEIFPFEEIDVNQLLGDLERGCFIVRYKINDQKIIQLINFHRHQKPHKNEPLSQFPEYSSNYQSARAERGMMNDERGMRIAEVAKNRDPKKGTRISPDWSPSEALLAWMKKERPDLDPALVSASFRDYWIAQPGRQGVKLDWDATFRNWVRRETRRRNDASITAQGKVKPGPEREESRGKL